MRKLLKRAAIVLGAMFLLIQVVRPSRENPPLNPEQVIHAQVEITPEARAVLERACRDCHTSQTRWPWYSQVAPTSWLVVDHVNHAREHMDLSEWAAYDNIQQAVLLEDMCKLASRGEMPLPSYLWMHRDARLTPRDVRALCEWTEKARAQLAMKAK